MSQHTTAFKATLIWLVLLALSAVSAYIGEFGQMNLFVLAVVILALVMKGQLIVDCFMDLRHVRVVWRLILSGFCVALGSIIYITYYLAQAPQ